MLASVCQRVGVSLATGNKALLKSYPWPTDGPWAKEVEVDGARYVVGQGATDPRFFVCFPLPFAGHADQYKTVLPINTPDDLLIQLGGPRREEVRRDSIPTQGQ